MTICIAAVCGGSQLGNARLVLCVDSQGSSALGKKSVMKDRSIGRGWRCLTAGADDAINVFLLHLRKNLTGLNPIDETNASTAVRSALRDRKLQRADEFTQGKWGLSYADFKKEKSHFPEATYREDMHEIGAMTAECDCIVAGFLDDGFPMLIQTDGKGSVFIREDFAVAGEGAYLAQASLMHRDQNDAMLLEQTIYNVYEAKKSAERVASVGAHTWLTVLNSKGNIDLLTDDGDEYFESLHRRHAPQEFKMPIVLQKAFFEPLRGEGPSNATSS